MEDIITGSKSPIPTILNGSGDLDESEILDQDQSQIIEKALFWSEKADLKEMEQVFDTFKDSP